MSGLSEAKVLVAEATADRVTWGDGTEYINVEDAARLVADAEQRGAVEALRDAADAADGQWTEQGLTGSVFVSHRTGRWLRGRASALAHPATDPDG